MSIYWKLANGIKLTDEEERVMMKMLCAEKEPPHEAK